MSGAPGRISLLGRVRRAGEREYLVAVIGPYEPFADRRVERGGKGVQELGPATGIEGRQRGGIEKLGRSEQHGESLPALTETRKPSCRGVDPRASDPADGNAAIVGDQPVKAFVGLQPRCHGGR